MAALRTNNYDLFVLIDENRDVVDRAHVNKLKKSMNKHGFIPSEAITVRKIAGSRKYEVTDGQHRVQAAKELGLFVYYKIDESVTIDILPDLQISKPWLPVDYLKLYSVRGNENYIKLKDLCNAYNKVSITTIATLLVGGASNGIHKSFNTGEMVVSHYDETCKTLRLASELFNEHPHIFLHSRMFLLIFSKILSIPDYDHRRMLDKLAYQSEKFKQMSTPKGYAEMFDNIYNFKAPASKRLKFEI